MKRKFKTFIVFCLAATQLFTSVLAATENPVTSENNVNATQNIVYDAYAEKQNTTTTGQGTSNEYVDTRTDEQKEDDTTNQEREDLINKINDINQQIQDAEDDNSKIQNPGSSGSSGNGSSSGGSSGSNTDYDKLNPSPNSELPDYINTNPTYTNPTLTLPSMDQWDLPTLTLPELPTIPDLPEYEPPESLIDDDDYDNLESHEPDLNSTYVIEGPNGIITVDQIAVPIGTVASIAETYKDLNDPEFNLPSVITPEITVGDEPETSDEPQGITPEDIQDMLDDWIEHIKETLPIVSIDTPTIGDLPSDGYVELPALDDLLPLPDLDDLDDVFDDVIDIEPLPGTDYEIAVPKDTTDLYNLLIRYIRRLMELNQTTITITRITQYQTREYAVRTIKTATPLAEYRWVVTGEDGDTVETTTDNRHLKMLFRGAGTYNVHVYNTQNVVRNNKVSGTKTEYWVLGNGDAYDGLLIYKNSSSFSGYIGTDIGPKLEEIELVKDGFNADVTPEMVNVVQLIDTYGNIRTPSTDYTTERH